IAVFALAMRGQTSGLLVTGVMVARAVAMLAGGPIAGVALDRLDRRRVMILSDVVRAGLAAAFVFSVHQKDTTLLYVLSFLLMFASPFFTAGRSAILPVIASRDELHTANSLTLTTQWTTTALGALLGGVAVSGFGYETAFLLNALSFVFSAFSIARLRGSFRAERKAQADKHAWRDFVEGVRYLRSIPLVFAIAMVGVGWALGGGASQILFSLFGEIVFQRGAAGIGIVWGAAAAGLVFGGFYANWLGKRIRFDTYKWAISACYVVHGGAYMLFSQMENFAAALVFIALSRAAVAVSSILNYTQVVTHVADEFRGRVFSTMDTLVWTTMMLSMTAAGVASQSVSPRTIGLWSGALSSVTVVVWAWANVTGRLPEPPSVEEPDEREPHPEPQP
nr:MFS transporter [Bryobacter sp.]